MTILSAGGVLYTQITPENKAALLASFASGLPSASAINTQPPLFDLQKNNIADGPIPIVYGQAQIGGKPFAIDYTAGTWTVGYMLCLGEIQSIESVLLNGATKTAATTIDQYLGTTSQTVNSKLQAAISGYSDDLIISDPAGDVGVAYIVVQYSEADYQSWPEVLVEVKGRKVWNPTTSTTVYSDNPALHLADLISSTTYGQGITVDDTDLIDAQAYCDDTTPGETRRESFLVIDRAQKTTAWVEILRMYASCFVVYRGDTAHIIPDKTGSSVMTITADDILDDSLTIIKSDSSDVPTVVRAYYTDTTGDEWRERLCDPAQAAGVSTGATPWRESRIRLTGIKRHSQALRECIERLDKLALQDLTVEWVQFDEGMPLELGDIVTLSHPLGLTNKLLRLISDPEEISPGRYRLRGREYDPAVYDDSVTNAPTYSDGNLPANLLPGAPTITSTTETVYQLANYEYASRIDVVWTAASGTVVGYNIEIKAGTDTVWTGTTTGLECATGPLKENVLYTVEVSAFNHLYSGTADTDSITLLGKVTPPAPPTGLVGSSVSNDLNLTWNASVDDDVNRYEVRYYATTETWADGTVYSRGDLLSLTSIGFFTIGQTYRFGVKSIDRVGTYSTTAAEVDVTIAAAVTGGGSNTTVSETAPSNPSDGDVWLKPISNADFLAQFVTDNAPDYSIVMNGSIVDSGSSLDSPAYTAGTYSAIPVPGRLNAVGIDALWAVWGGTDLDAHGGDHVVCMTLYIPPISDLTDNRNYGLYSNGGATAGQGIYIGKWAGETYIYAGHANSTTNAQGGLVSQEITEGFHTITAIWADGGLDSDYIILVLDGQWAQEFTGTHEITNGTQDPLIGLNVSDTHNGSACFSITSSGIVIGDFVEENSASSKWLTADANGRNLVSKWHGAAASGGTETYVWDEATSTWVQIYEPITPATEVENGRVTFLADSAQTTADTAQVAAETANASLADLADDNILSVVEKSQVLLQYDTIIEEQTGIDGEATRYGITTEKTAYDAAVSALTSYLNGLTTPVPWWNLTGDTTIVGDTFRLKFQDVYTTRQTLLDAIAAAAKSLADTADGKAVTAQADADTALLTAQAATITLDSGVKTSSFTAVKGNRYLIDGSTNAVTMTLPASPTAGDTVHFSCYEASWFINECKIARNGNPIEELAEDMVLDQNYFSGALQYIDATIGWKLV